MSVRLVSLLLGLFVGGCVAQPDRQLLRELDDGEFGRARVRLQDNVSNDRNDRNYMLDRLKLGIVALADGVPVAAEQPLEEVYRILRTQGINQDKEAVAVILNEDLKTWKGEPFEQALAFHYVAVYHAQRDEWDNARAATGNSLFQLRDFGDDRAGQRLDKQGLVERAARDETFLDKGYVETETNFALGYLMNAIANQNLRRQDEADDNFHRTVELNRSLQPLVDELSHGEYNTILVVDFGPGPQKIGTGPDEAIASFRPLQPSDTRPLLVTTREGTFSFPIVCDVNTMAADHMWNNLEDVRLAKSTVGNLLLFGGMGAGGYGLASGDETAGSVGLGMMLAGLFAKAGAHADTRYCEAIPQRIYVVTLSVQSSDQPVELMVEGLSNSRLTVLGLPVPAPGQKQLRYLRLPWPRVAPVPWAVSGALYYNNDAMAATATASAPSELPYILGGRCARTLTYEMLAQAQAAGFLAGMSLSQLEDLYRAEGIEIVRPQDITVPGLHVLEGGDWRFIPEPGSTGFMRLYGQLHPPYQPRSRQVREQVESVRALRAAANQIESSVSSSPAP